METSCFVTDIFLPQMLYALTLRSPIAKGRLVSIECPKLPGSYTLVTAKDIPGKNVFEDFSGGGAAGSGAAGGNVKGGTVIGGGFPVLVDKEIAYMGEPVALLVGPNKNTLEEYSRRCNIIVEEGTPIFSPAEAAASAGAFAAKRDIRIGDPETAFAQAASVVRGSYSTGIQEHWYAERTGAVVWPEGAEVNAEITPDAPLVIRTATQWPFHVRRSVAQVLGLPAAKVRVQPTITGLHMDGKLWYPSLISCHAALGAWITKKPVRLVLTREEDFSYSPKRCGTEISIASALDEKGEVTGVEINTLVNLGSYGVNAAETLDHVNLGSLGVYKTKNIRLSSVAVKTNIPPQGPFAGFGLAQGFFAMERHVSHVADQLNHDPAQWRSENGIKAGTLPPGMSVKDAATVQELVNAAMKMSDYRRKWASYELLRQNRRKSPEAKWAERGESLRGIGIALGYQANGFLYSGIDKGFYSIELILEKDGALEINTSMVSIGKDYGSLWAEIACRILGVEKEMVRIHCEPDSPDSGPLTMSRTIAVLTRLVEQSCLDISRKRFRDPLPIVVRKTVRPQKNPQWEESFPSPRGADYNSFARLGWASAIVEVEIDPIEYLPHIRGVWMGVNGGRILSEDRARKILKDSAVQALGWAYREQISYVNGVIPAEQYDDFDIPYPSEIPPVSIDFVNNRPHDEPKGVGDIPFACIPAAYVQAVSQAMDHHFQSIPLKAFDIWDAGVSKRKAGGQA